MPLQRGLCFRHNQTGIPNIGRNLEKLKEFFKYILRWSHEYTIRLIKPILLSQFVFHWKCLWIYRKKKMLFGIFLSEENILRIAVWNYNFFYCSRKCNVYNETFSILLNISLSIRNIIKCKMLWSWSLFANKRVLFY